MAAALPRGRGGWPARPGLRRALSTASMKRCERASAFASRSPWRTPSNVSSPGLQRGQRQDRRRAGQEPPNVTRGFVVRRRSRKARNGPSSLRAASWSVSWSCSDDVEEGRRAGAAVQIFVAAANREIAAAAVQVELDRAGAVRQVPQGERSGGMSGGVQRRHVVPGAASVVDMGQEQDRGVARRAPGQARQPGRPSASSAAGDSASPCGRVEVGREIALLGEDRRAGRAAQRRRRQEA